MKYIVNSEQMKAAEENVPLFKLMENAGRASYKKLVEIVGSVMGKTFVVLSGSGNNGGDGIVIAKRLQENGGEVLSILMDGMPKSECSREAYAKYSGSLDIVVYSSHLDALKTAMENCDVVIDAVFGTGFHGTLGGEISELFSFINNLPSVLKVSIDLPSGMNSDTGEISENAFKPDHTFMLGAAKVGVFSLKAFTYAGHLSLLDIGIPISAYKNYSGCITEEDILSLIPRRHVAAHKGTYGRLLNIAGSEQYIGAALLSSKGALKTGVGLLTLATAKFVCSAIASEIPESVFIPLYTDENGFIEEDATEIIAPKLKNFTAVAIGCGLGKTEETRRLTEYVIKNAVCPIILDADGINIVATNINILHENDKPKILTPHPTEFSRLTGLSVKEIQENRMETALDFAAKHNVVLVLKGANTVIAAPDGRVSINITGNAGLAKGGSGDVLTGMIASFAAQGVNAYEAAVLGVYMHGLAADRIAENMALYGIMPSEVADYLPYIK